LVSTSRRRNLRLGIVPFPVRANGAHDVAQCDIGSHDRHLEDLLQIFPCRKRLAPIVPTTAKAVPTGPDYIHEIKYDGYRLMVARSGDRVRLIGLTARHRGGVIQIIWMSARRSCGSDADNGKYDLIDQLTEHDRIELLARAQDAWDRAPQDTISDFRVLAPSGGFRDERNPSAFGSQANMPAVDNFR
jgi:hypothetical protein